MGDLTGARASVARGLAPAHLSHVVARYDLSLELEPRGATLSGVMLYAADLFTAETIDRVCTLFVRGLEALVSTPAAPIAEWQLLSEAERETLIRTWNDTADPYPPHGLHEGFEAQAAATPDAIAVESEAGHLTYAMLDDRAARLAGVLRARGVGAESRVGICLQRTPDPVFRPVRSSSQDSRLPDRAWRDRSRAS